MTSPLPYCAIRAEHDLRPKSAALAIDQMAALRVHAAKWANYTTLTYAFFDHLDTDPGPGQVLVPHPWRGRPEERDVVRNAFKQWKKVGIGLSFREVADPFAAMIRIGFAEGDGSWSYVGTGCLSNKIAADQRTMNFGWTLLSSHGRDTALHEIGHALGMPHEHQNPNSGIEWDEDAVRRYLSAPPNSWDDPTIEYNVLRKLPKEEVEGSAWDRNSIMHYHFAAGLIVRPVDCQSGITPAGGLSALDHQWVRKFYPSEPASYLKLVLGKAHEFLDRTGAQTNFTFVPKETRPYWVTAVGEADKRISIVEELANGDETFLKSDDDSTEDRDASLQIELIRGRRYKIFVNTQFSREAGNARLHIA